MEQEIKKQLDILGERLKKVQENADDTRNQMDQDRTDIDRVRIDVARISAQQDTIIKNMGDFRISLRQTVQDTVREEVPKAIKKELEKIEMANPKKVFIINRNLFDWIKNIFIK